MRRPALNTFWDSQLVEIEPGRLKKVDVVKEFRRCLILVSSHQKVRLAFTSLACFSLGIIYSAIRDPRDFLINDFAPKDAEIYRVASITLFESDVVAETNTRRIFQARVLYPLLNALLSRSFGFRDTFSAYLVDLTSIFAALICCTYIWRKTGLRNLTVIFLSIFFLFSWNFPLRMSGAWPNAGFGIFYLPPLLFLISIFVLKSKNKFNKLIVLLVSVVAVSIRETYLLFAFGYFFVCALYTIFYSIQEKPQKRENNKDLKSLVQIVIWILVPALVSNFLIQARIGASSSYDGITVYAEYLWKNLNLFTVFSAFFSSLGLIALTVILLLARGRNFHVAKVLRFRRELLVFCLVGTVISVLGGAEPERYLTWIFPALAVFAGKYWEYLLDSKCHLNILTIMVVVFFLSSRVLVPNLPDMFPVNESEFCGVNGIKTNYNPSVYSGIPGLSNFQLPLRTVPKESISFEPNIGRSSLLSWKSNEIQLPSEKFDCKTGLKNPYFNGYQFELNMIPAPLGFQHNHFEFFALWTYWTDFRVTIVITAQWLVLITILLKLQRRKIR